MYPVKLSTALTVPFFAHDSNGDGVTGLVDGGFTKRISKDGGAFGAMTVTITELENGWYSLPLGTGHTDTIGVLTVSISHGSTKRVNLQWRVSTYLAGESVLQTGDSFARLGAPAGASVSADIAVIEAQTDDIGVAGAGLTDLGGMSATMQGQVNTELNDYFDATNFAEPGQDTPSASTTLATKIGYLYKFLRNRITQTSTTLKIYNDDGTTVGQKAAVSDDGTTYDRGEITTGP